MSTLEEHNSAAEAEDWLCEDDDDDRHVLEREWNARRHEFHVSGMREGYEAGKEETVQEGFDQGFQLGALKGYEWGCVKGAVQALAQSQSDVDDIESIRLLTHSSIKKQVCGSLYSEYGEMKDRFPEHESSDVTVMAEEQNSAKELAEKSLARSGIEVQRLYSHQNI